MEFEVGRWNIHRGDGEVELIVAKPPQPLPAGADLEIDADPGALLPEPLQVFRQQVHGGDRPGSDAQDVPCDAMVPLGEGVGETVHVVHERHGETVDPLTVPTEDHVRPAALEQ